MRVVVADDEPVARRGIIQLLSEYPETDVVAQCVNGVEAVAAIERHGPDLVILDVQMPEMDGFEVVRSVGVSAMPAVIFVTAHDEFAVRAFEAAAVDYIMKPVAPSRFSTAMRRVRERRDEADAARKVGALEDLLARVVAPVMRISIPAASGTVLVDPSEIDWIEADDYYAVVHVGDKRYMMRESLSALEQRLSMQTFIRVHRSAIVNCDRVRELRHGWLVLRDGTRVPISRRRSESVSRKLRSPDSLILR